MKTPKDLLLELHFGQKDLGLSGSWLCDCLSTWPELPHMLSLDNKYQRCRIFCSDYRCL